MTAGTCGPHSTWSSPLAATLQRFLEGKRAARYRHPREAEMLNVLDRFLAETLSLTDPVITSDIVRAFVARRGTESETTRAHRLTLIREVCRFLALDDPRTFVPAARFLGIQPRSGVPRVLSLDEGRRSLDACDTLHRHRSSPRRELILRTLLVLLYLTGLRADEGPSPHLGGRRSADRRAPHSRHQVRQVPTRARGRQRRGSTRAVPSGERRGRHVNTASRRSSVCGRRGTTDGQRIARASRRHGLPEQHVQGRQSGC